MLFLWNPQIVFVMFLFTSALCFSLPLVVFASRLTRRPNPMFSNLFVVLVPLLLMRTLKNLMFLCLFLPHQRSFRAFVREDSVSDWSFMSPKHWFRSVFRIIRAGICTWTSICGNCCQFFKRPRARPVPCAHAGTYVDVPVHELHGNLRTCWHICLRARPCASMVTCAHVHALTADFFGRHACGLLHTCAHGMIEI